MFSSGLDWKDVYLQNFRNLPIIEFLCSSQIRQKIKKKGMGSYINLQKAES